MKLLFSFIKLVRWSNLIFIVLAQGLFYIFIEYPIYSLHSTFPVLDLPYFLLLCFSTICIAAGGYIINDYFDVNIDMINKPNKLIIEKKIKRRWAILWHLALSILGIALGFYIDYNTPTSLLGLTNTICVILLFIYSISLKRKLLSGNVVVSLLTAWTILVVPFAEWNALFHNPTLKLLYSEVDFNKLYRIAFLYTGFAFIVSIIREVIKDMEDIQGDMQHGCYTMPIAWGIRTAKVFTGIWIVVLTSILIIIQFYIWNLGWRWAVAYCTVLIILPLCLVFKKLLTAQTAIAFHILSFFVKCIMLTGILSMIIF